MAFLAFVLSLCLALPATRARAASEDTAAAPEISQPASFDIPAAPTRPDSALLAPDIGASLPEFAPLPPSAARPVAAVAAPRRLAARAAASVPVVLPAPAAALEGAPAHETPAAVPAAKVSASASPRAPPRAALAEASDLAPSAASGRKGASASAGEKASEIFDGGRRLNILTAGAEAVPFIKTGGLADVVDAVSRGLAARGHRVMLALPKYRGLKLGGAQFAPAGEISVPMGEGVETARLLAAKINGVDIVLIDHPGYYDRHGGPYQGQASSYSEDDNDERFAFYARASLEAAKLLGFKPDVIHAHDWHAALIPAFLKSAYAADPFFTGTKTAITIHNLAFQGVFTPGIAQRLGLPSHYLEPMAPLEYWGKASYLK
ncbi:MAG: glycogen/starch synthase, partial [Elusimicrobia bacterium]|nr:glycogen/starch synthase [Elusimicrobiota bacterium]